MNSYSTENAAERKSWVGDINNVGSKALKEVILSSIPEEWAECQTEGYIHIHDLEAYGLTYNCLALNHLGSFPYNRFIKATQQRKIIYAFAYLRKVLEDLGNEQSGGMSFANFDLEISEILQKLDIKLTEENKELISADIGAFINWANDCHTRMGQVSYYITLNIGLGTDEYSRFISKTILNEFQNAVQSYKPNIVFKVKDGVNAKEGDPNFDLLKQSLACTSLKMIPTYLLCDSDANKHVPAQEIAIMGCRTRVVADLYGKETSIGRGNICNITINLVRLALESQDSTDPFNTFCNKWDYLANTTKDILIDRYIKLCQKKGCEFSVNNRLGLWLEPFTDNENVEHIFKHGTLSIGFIGLSEAIEILTGKKFYEDEKSLKLAYGFVKHMREFCDSLIEKYQLNFSLLATSGEMISGSFLEKDQKRFTHKVMEKKFYTNSFHVNVDSQINSCRKLEIEGPFHSLTNGGCISYIEMKSSPSGNIEALLKLIQTATSHGVSYLGFNFPIDSCDDCNHKGIINGTCPVCGSSSITRIRRVSGYLENLSFFTAGKRNEEMHRLPNKMEV